MKRRAWLIFNPVAGRGNGETDLSLIEQTLQEKYDLHVLLTGPEQEADALAREALACGAEIVIASGGDGTLSAVAGAVAGSPAALGIIPRGTANSVALALQLPQDLPSACRVILQERTRRIDIARCNGQPMILHAGIGYGARTIGSASRESKNALGVLAYILSGLQQLQDLEQFTVTLETEEQLITCKAVAVTVANLAPPTSVLAQGPAAVQPEDGELDITIIAASGLVEAVTTGYHLLWTALRDQPAQRENVGFLRARKVRIVADPPQELMVDGELVGTTPMEIECLAGALNVLIDTPQDGEQPAEQKLEGLPGLQVELKE
ncbi:YegS/Rv2252/BmrU family lipid kinase [Gloeobacter violaceus]|uniref:Glr2480 protein n=1 Tax=Gloeobacter violaceus (strain ATCC 29082 / PCC 7421) TaxID=251221 RepID=Q7NHQ5_GLOVI|nr:YegS/Rv2252/BmrU family lipid kinase [Gloeobacter violaceus]BAC90421.1 glr2480 [Gloeobacter violaceus PCC 7421]